MPENNQESPRKDFFSQEEFNALALALVDSTGGTTIEEISRFVQWAHEACVRAELVNLVIKGLVSPHPDPDNSDYKFSRKPRSVQTA